MGYKISNDFIAKVSAPVGEDQAGTLCPLRGNDAVSEETLRR